jgi:hypothetical protein
VGGRGFDSVRDVATDVEGNVYLTGGTASPDFGATPGAVDPSFNGGNSDVFVAKLTAAGDIVWATYLGGPGHDRGYALEVGPDGYVYVAGRAGERFPVTAGALQERFSGGRPEGPYTPQDAFLAKLSPDGSRLVFATYFGAEDTPEEIIRDIAVWKDGSILFAGGALSGGYAPEILDALSRGFGPAKPGGKDVVVGRLSPDGSALVWLAYAGGSGREWGQPSLRMDGDGNVFVVTVSESADAPTTSGVVGPTFAGESDFYLVKFDVEGRLGFATYLGGSAMEHLETHTLALDPEGSPVVAAGTESDDFPTTEGSLQRRHGGNGGGGTGRGTNYPGDGVIVRLSADGTRLLASTFLGGRHGESVEGVAIAPDGRIFVTGATFSDDFPVTGDAYQLDLAGPAGAFAVLLAPGLDRMLYSTHIGATTPTGGRTAHVHGSGRFWFGGEATGSAEGFPVIGPVTGPEGESDGWVVALELSDVGGDR